MSSIYEYDFDYQSQILNLIQFELQLHEGSESMTTTYPYKFDYAKIFEDMLAQNEPHPEATSDEIWITNGRRADFESISWTTKRRGNIAYDINGVPIKKFYSETEDRRQADREISLKKNLNDPTYMLSRSYGNLYPVFIKKWEVEEKIKKIKAGVITS